MMVKGTTHPQQELVGDWVDALVAKGGQICFGGKVVDVVENETDVEENVHLNDVDVVDKPGGLNNASAYVGLVPAHKAGLVLLANRGNFPHEIGRYRVLPGTDSLTVVWLGPGITPC